MRVTFNHPHDPNVRVGGPVTVPPDMPLTDEAGNRIGTVISAEPSEDGTGLLVDCELDDDSPYGHLLAKDALRGVSLPDSEDPNLPSLWRTP